MKKLYKRISAILLAGAIIFGGAFSSGLSVHANSSKVAIGQLGESDKEVLKEVQEVCNKLGFKVHAMLDNSGLMDSFIKKHIKKYPSIRNRLLSSNKSSVISLPALEYYLEHQNLRFVRFQFQEHDFLVYRNKSV